MINQKKSGGKVSADRAPATDWLLLSQKQIHFAYFRLCIAYQMLKKQQHQFCISKILNSILHIANKSLCIFNQKYSVKQDSILALDLRYHRYVINPQFLFPDKLVEESAGRYRPWSTLDTPGSSGGEEEAWNFADVGLKSNLLYLYNKQEILWSNS